MNSENNLIQGLVLKAYSGHYYVCTAEGDQWECATRGRFRYEKQQVLVGDWVKLAPQEDRTGVIMQIAPRRSILIRPPIANVEQAVIVFSVRDPAPNIGLLDRFLITTLMNRVEPVICFNKIDLLGNEPNELISRYHAGYPLVQTSVPAGTGLDSLRELLRNKVSVFAGPSGVGKSTLLNAIMPDLKLKTGSISKKLKRGKHTTRHVELLSLAEGGWVADTPGFSSLDLPDLPLEELADYFPEMADYSDGCRFHGCLHDQEPDCAVKEAVAAGKMAASRYQQYIDFSQELKGRRRY